MPWAGGNQADSVSVVMNIVRIEQIRIRRRLGAELIATWWWLILLVCAFTLFACMFELGRLTSVKSAASEAAAPQETRIASVRAGIPQGLRPVAPIPPLAAAPPKPKANTATGGSRPVTVAAPVQAPTAEVFPAPAIVHSPRPSVSPAPAPARAPSADR